MGEILSAAPGFIGAGASGLLIFLVIVLIKANRDDRAQHRETLAAVREDHRKEATDLMAKIDRLEKRLDDLQRVLDDQRELRRAAEDRAGRAAAQLAALEQVTGVAHDPATTRLAPPSTAGMAPGPDPDDERRDPGRAGTGWEW